jgi:3-mercaptopyruvate sulfurtransferase SseA
MQPTVKKISTSSVLDQLNNPQTIIIDVRPVDAYNGWELKQEKRGGHIPGAKSLPLKWTTYIDWIEMVNHKNITPFHNLIIYGYSSEEAETVAGMFVKTGFENISVYPDFFEEWLNSQHLPLNRLKRYRNLVSASWVKQLTDGQKPIHYENNKVVIVHAHYRNRNAYLSGHIPGAIDMDTNDLESPETWNRRSPEELKEALEKHGISADTTVIMYGKFMSPRNEDPFPGSAAGDLGAIRCAFIMLYAVVKDVRVINGGFQSWEDAGFEISTADDPKNPIADFGSNIPRQPQLAVDTPKAKEMLASTDAELVSVRSWPEFIGEVSGYNYIEKKGRIPGAIFADCGSDAYHMENYRNFDHTTREYQEIKEIWRQNGITPDKHLAFYCGTGWRGSEAWFNAWLMGWPNVSVYDGGWFEWSNDPLNPYETGIPETVGEQERPAI